MREVIIWGHMPDWSGLFLYTLISLFIAMGGYLFFIKTRKGFADVL
jgi:lipopolysaccharide transport system permease protein